MVMRAAAGLLVAAGLAGGLGYGIGRDADGPATGDAVVSQAPAAMPAATARQAPQAAAEGAGFRPAAVPGDPTPLGRLHGLRQDAGGAVPPGSSRQNRKAQVYGTVCETKSGECTVTSAPINSYCSCGNTPGRITR